MARNRDLLGEADRKLKAGDARGGIALMTQFLKESPNDPRANRVRANLGEICLGLGQLIEAGEQLERALEEEPNSPRILYRLAQTRAFEGRAEEAFGLLDRLLAIDPDHDAGLSRRAALLQYVGRVDEAAAVIDEAYARGLESPHLAHAFAGIASGLGRRREAIARIEPYTKDSTQSRKLRAEMYFQLGRLLDGEGEYDRAWQAYEHGNGLLKPFIDASVLDRISDETIAAWTKEAIAGLERSEEPGERAVFILGMPRSGTTLIEQFLGAHRDVAAGGELQAFARAVESIPGSRGHGPMPPLGRVRGNALRRASRSYMEALEAVSADAARVTDKMPTNFRLLGLVPSLVPGAHVIHCTRDAMDACLSCYFRNFAGEHLLLTDLRWIGKFYCNYVRLMKHWQDVLADQIEMIDASYERVVQHFEEEARRIVAFLGLEFDAACLAFDEQRRMAPTLEPEQAGRNVYASSLGRWRNYEKHLRPLIEELGELGPGAM